jgi:hypothetical protein
MPYRLDVVCQEMKAQGTYHLTGFFVSVDNTGLNFPVSPLEAILVSLARKCCF